MIWRLIPYRCHDAFENMAVDEAIFRETLINHQPPTLRFFGWCRPSVSIGYFQEFKKEIHAEKCRLNCIDVVRRITGGKAVYHWDEVTYSVAAARTEACFPDHIGRTYEIISRCLSRGLAGIGLDAHLAGTALHKSGSPKRPSTPCCFSVPSGNELVMDGRKICGSAQTRTQEGFLQHGSLLLKFDPLKSTELIRETLTAEQLRESVAAVNELLAEPLSAEALCFSLQKGFADELGVAFREGTLTDAELALSRALLKKYQSSAWNHERKKAADQFAK